MNVDTGNDDLDAIIRNIEDKRALISRFPTLRPLIENFEKWWQGLGWYAVHIKTTDTLNEAKRQRNVIQKVIGEKIPDDWTPADAPVTVPDAPKEPLIPTWAKLGVLVASVVGGVGYGYYKVSTFWVPSRKK